MGRVINPRGTSGSGKTWLVRQVMAASRGAGAVAEPLCREGRARPIGWRFAYPSDRRPLAIIGHYEATRGGIDTIPKTDGGLDEAFRLADALAADGHDVLMEGYQLSGEVERTVALSQAQRARGARLHVLWLDVLLERCVQNVMARRRAGRAARPSVERTARAGHDALGKACQVLQHAGVDVERLDTAEALHRTLAWLDLDPAAREGSGEGPLAVGQSHEIAGSPHTGSTSTRSVEG
ncbi:hypothetical protein [Rubellimicrobium roseum]|uniref:Uncharacterized protein n=1 Tax=Rubellimicrobium roseum TaxID=687525 RepID=A0A5C4N3I8_9RHOB|nr:hypothetical protein [Rubellimicrobium roseum]TNC60459.1 hypothetical protein FHG71_22045 [Rubellimicrobium roseum]